MSLPERDKLSYSKQWCEARIATMFGGRVAEQLIYGEDQLNTGASSDIMQATELARRMVTEWGMSEKLGPLRYNENQQEVFLGHAITQRQNMSEDTAKLIDEEIRRIVTDGEKKAREVLFANRDKLEAITQALMEFETISGEEVQALHARREDRARDRRRGDQGPGRSRGSGRRQDAPAAAGARHRRPRAAAADLEPRRRRQSLARRGRLASAFLWSLFAPLCLRRRAVARSTASANRFAHCRAAVAWRCVAVDAAAGAK